MCSLALAAATITCGKPTAPTPNAPPATVPDPSTTVPAAPPVATAPMPPPACAVQQGALATFSISAAVRAAVYLPPCAGDGRRFPTVYLLHGAGADETQWPAIGLARTAEELIAAKAIPPLIVVMPNWLAAGENTVVDTVVPWADASLPTSPQRADRSIGGISAGGAAAMRLVALRPELFSRLGGHSPVVDARLGTWDGRVWLDVGLSDGLRQETEALAARLGSRAELHEWPGQHDRAYWGAHVADYLAFYAGP